jgi:predicted Zn-dependent protease
MKNSLLSLTLLGLALLSGCATNPVTGRSQLMLVSEKAAISQSAQAYSQMIGSFDKNGKVDSDTALKARVDGITGRLIAQAVRYRPETREWDWSVKVIDEPDTINAFCMPGGKIAFFTGILERLQLTDDEVAIIMGHEIAHALREHARERAAKTTLTSLTGRIVGTLLFGQAGDILGAAGSNLLTLKFSRDDEREADLVGMELAARAGYDPTAGITLWEKMTAAAKGAPPQWMSTHPSGESRIQLIKDHLKDVQPLYERAKAAKAAGSAPDSLRREEPKGDAGGSLRSGTFPPQTPPSGPRP